LKNILQNLLILAVGDVASKLLGFFAVAYMARVLGPGDFGVVNIGFAMLGYLTLIASPGVHLFGTRSVASGESEATRNIISISTLRLAISSLLLVVTLLVTIRVEGSSNLAPLVLLFACTLIPLSISLDWYFQGREWMGMITWSRLILNGLYLAFLLGEVRGSDDLLWIPVSFFVGNIGASLFLLVVCLKDESSRLVSAARSLTGFWKRGKEILVASLPLGIGSMLAQVAFHFPPILIGFWIGHEEVGHFSAAMRIVFALMILDRVTSVVFFPLVSRFWISDRKELPVLSGRFLRMIMILTLPVCVMTLFFAPELIRAIYGEAFRDAVEVLRILIWFFFFTSLNTVFLFGLMGVGGERRYAKIMAAGTLVQIGAMVILAAFGGLTGVAGGFVLGELIIFILAWRAYREVVAVDLFGAFLKPAVSSLVMGLILYSIPVPGLRYGIPMATGIFLATLIVTRGIRRDDIESLRREL
jgi:O-antigen/teichoic acid export membrane protein